MGPAGRQAPSLFQPSASRRISTPPKGGNGQEFPALKSTTSISQLFQKKRVFHAVREPWMSFHPFLPGASPPLGEPCGKRICAGGRANRTPPALSPTREESHTPC